MSWIAGIDYSSFAIDVVLIDENDVDITCRIRHELKGSNAFDRTRSVRESLRQLWALDYWAENCIAIGIEDPRGQNAGAIYRIQGAILTELPTSVLVEPWVPSQWRKAVGLSGNASKDVVANYVHGIIRKREIERRVTRTVPWPQDACDAFCIALATKNAIEKKQAA